MNLYLSQIAKWLENTTGTPQQIIHTNERADIRYIDHDSQNAGMGMTIIADADIDIKSISWSGDYGIGLNTDGAGSENGEKVHVILWSGSEISKDERGYYMDAEGALNGELVLYNPKKETTSVVIKEMLGIEVPSAGKSAKTDFEEELQTLMDEFYSEWQREENKGKDKWDVLKGFPEAHQMAVVFGNFNYQVENGGISQWIYNSYFHDDAEKFIEYLEAGADSDERFRTILDRVYKLDQYAEETDCDRYGNYYDPDNEDGEGGFIGDMINCDAFDTWYYDKCGNEDWWKTVRGVIEKVTGQALAPANQEEHTTPSYSPLRAYIENAHDDSIGGFTMPLPATPEMFKEFFDGAEITGWQDLEIVEVYSDINGLGEILTETVKKTMSPNMLDELNYLAARLQELHGDEHGYGIFAAAVEAKRHGGDITQIINITFAENINRFDCWPVFDEKEYGEILVNQFLQDEHAEAFVRLRDSENPADRAFAAHIEKLEAHVDKKAFGRTVAKEQDGVFTEHGYLIGGDDLQTLYHGPRDIPAEYRIFKAPDEIGKQPLTLCDADIAATVMQMHAVCNGSMDYAPDNLKTLFHEQNGDYLLLINRDDVFLSPVIEAYKRGTETSAFISLAAKSSAERPDFAAFAVRINSQGEDGVFGDFIELNGKALCANIARHAVAPDRVDVIYSNGASKSYDLWDWAELPTYAKDDIREHTPHYPDAALSEAAKRFYSLACANETVSEAVGADVFLTEAGAAFMAAAEHPRSDMIRIGKDTAVEMLARGDADVYRLLPEGVNKLSAIEATRLSRHTGNCELAIRREGLAGLEKWAERKVGEITCRAERGERDKTKNNREEL